MARVSNRGGTTSLIRHLQILRTVTEAVSRSLDLNEVIQKSLSALTDVTGHEIASLHLVSVDGKMLLLRGERGLSDRVRMLGWQRDDLHRLDCRQQIEEWRRQNAHFVLGGVYGVEK